MHWGGGEGGWRGWGEGNLKRQCDIFFWCSISMATIFKHTEKARSKYG